MLLEKRPAAVRQVPPLPPNIHPWHSLLENRPYNQVNKLLQESYMAVTQLQWVLASIRPEGICV
jgi:hypothetical protein